MPASFEPERGGHEEDEAFHGEVLRPGRRFRTGAQMIAVHIIHSLATGFVSSRYQSSILSGGPGNSMQ